MIQSLKKPKTAKSRCHYLIALPYRRIPLESLALTKRLHRGLKGLWHLGDLHGLSRKDILSCPSIGPKSLQHLEEILFYALGPDGFTIIPEYEWREPALPGIMGIPLIEIR